MSQLQVNDRVRLLHDLPDLMLHRGHEGVVTSVWFAPECAYEVEFAANAATPDGPRDGSNFPLRKVLQASQVEAASAHPSMPMGGTAEAGPSAYTSRG